MAASAERQAGTFGRPPRAEPAFKPGDVVTVVPERANLMRGADVVTVVRGGQRIVVVEVRSQWVGAYVFTDGEKKGGWLRTSDFIPVADSAKREGSQACPCAMQTAAAAPQPPTADAACRVVRTEPTQDYFQDYYVGYYERHELDPDLTVWEPWRH
jgi:hypothetical protein